MTRPRCSSVYACRDGGRARVGGTTVDVHAIVGAGIRRDCLVAGRADRAAVVGCSAGNRRGIFDRRARRTPRSVAVNVICAEVAVIARAGVPAPRRCCVNARGPHDTRGRRTTVNVCNSIAPRYVINCGGIHAPWAGMNRDRAWWLTESEGMHKTHHRSMSRRCTWSGACTGTAPPCPRIRRGDLCPRHPSSRCPSG